MPFTIEPARVTTPEVVQQSNLLDRRKIEEMSREELMADLARLSEERAVIQNSLEAARLRRWHTGEIADPDWYRRAVMALRFKGVRHQRIQQHLAVMRSRQQKTLDGYFVDAARRLLSREQFGEVMQAARAVQAASQDQ